MRSAGRASVVLAILAAILVLTATPVAATGKPEHNFYEPTGFQFAPGEVCEFGVLVEVVSGRAHDAVRVLEDGTLHIRTTGALKARLTNLSTDESIVRNFSGPVDFWLFPDGTGASWNRGHALAWLTPAEGGPALWHQRGTIRWAIDANGLFTVVHQTGTSEDLCAALR